MTQTRIHPDAEGRNGRSVAQLPESTVPPSSIVVPQKVFKCEGPSVGPTVPTLFAAAEKVLQMNPLELEPDKVAIRTQVGREGAEEAVRQQAMRAFHREPVRTAQRTVSCSVREAYERLRLDLSRQYETAIRARDAVASRVIVRTKLRFENMQFTTTNVLSVLPALTQVVFLVLLFITAFVFEVVNAVNFTQSGLGFEENLLGALAFAFFPITGLYVALKWSFTVAGQKHREWIVELMKRWAMPLMVGTNVLFGTTVGLLNEGDIFGQSWHPPLWILFAVLLPMLAVNVAMIGMLMRSALDNFYEDESKPSQVHEDADAQVRSIAACLSQVDHYITWSKKTLERLEKDCADYAERCVGELYRQQRALAAKSAQAFLEDL